MPWDTSALWYRVSVVIFWFEILRKRSYQYLMLGVEIKQRNIIHLKCDQRLCARTNVQLKRFGSGPISSRKAESQEANYWSHSFLSCNVLVWSAVFANWPSIQLRTKKSRSPFKGWLLFLHEFMEREIVNLSSEPSYHIHSFLSSGAFYNMTKSRKTNKQRKMEFKSSSKPVDRFNSGQIRKHVHQHQHQSQHQQSPTKRPVQLQQQHHNQQQQTAKLTPSHRTNQNSSSTKPVSEMFDPTIVAQYMQWKTASRAGPGLLNHGNTCFLNSTIQCLLHTPALSQILVKESKLAIKFLDPDSILHLYQRYKYEWTIKKARYLLQFQPVIFRHNFYCLLRFVTDVWTPATPKKSMSPRSMVQNIRRVGKQFRPNRQEDAHEYLRQLLDCMHEEIMKANNVQTSDGKLAETSLISRVFGGYLRNELKCSKCTFSSKTYNHFQDLSLEITGGISSG